MKRQILFLPSLLLLSACSSNGVDVSQTVDTIVQTGSGLVGTVSNGVRDTVELTKQGIENVTEGVQEAKKRVDNVTKGVATILEGAAFVGSGVKVKW